MPLIDYPLQISRDSSTVYPAVGAGQLVDISGVKAKLIMLTEANEAVWWKWGAIPAAGGADANGRLQLMEPIILNASGQSSIGFRPQTTFGTTTITYLDNDGQWVIS